MDALPFDQRISDGPAVGMLIRQPRDALLALIGLHRVDPRLDKIDLGVGVYRDETGATPIMRAVKAAERQLVLEQDTKAYLSAEGDTEFVALLAEIVLGAGLASSDRIMGVQTPGGTGALRLGAELIARSHPAATVWLSTPTWPNHRTIFQDAGLSTRTYYYFDVATRDIDIQAMVEALDATAAGDVLLLHGCSHDPTGTSFDAEQWRIVTELLVARGVTPFIDLASQGLGDGLEADAAGLRNILAAAPTAFVAYSCDKNFGLYRDLVGALFFQAPRSRDATLLRQNMLVLAPQRGMFAMLPCPPVTSRRFATIAQSQWRQTAASTLPACAERRSISSPKLSSHLSTDKIRCPA